MSDYRLDAIELIKKIDGKGSGLLKDEDAIGSVATSLMLAEHNFDPNRGTALNTVRTCYAINEIKHIKKHYNRRSNIIDNYKNSGLIRNIANVNSDIHFLENSDLLKNLFEKANLTEKQKIAVEKKFFHNETYNSISKELNISKRRSEQLVKISLKKLKKAYDASQLR